MGKAKKFTKVVWGESGSKILQIATSTVDKTRDQISPYEYHVTEVDLGHASRAQVTGGFDDSSQAVKVKMRMLEEIY